jgi:hypothetical protein
MIFFLSLDGTHCPINEPRPFSTIWSSHKLGGHAGVNYEVGLSISRPKLIWLYGPTQPGAQNDLEVAKSELVPAVQAYGQGQRWVIADGIYAAEEVSDVFSTKNDYDPREIAAFKERVSARHESFNNLLKKWKILAVKFRIHDLAWHKPCFEAVACICCYQLDNDSYSLFDSYPIT